mmetsp:Transcript_62440/g.186017  ORF Transcript_62440/g.186017 Transcript_62440/m.186017 type:complete len:320 (+) Transcript_62440:455-1414(+)
MAGVTLGLLLRHQVAQRAVLLVPRGPVAVEAAREGLDLAAGLRELPGVTVDRVADQRLQEADALLGGGMARVGRPQGLQLLGALAVGGVVLAVGRLQHLHLPEVLVGGLAHRPLQALDALGQRGVVRVPLPHVLELLGVLGMGVVDGLQLLCVLVSGLAQQTLHASQSFVRGAVPLARFGEVLQVPVVGLPESLQLLRVPVRRVPEPLLQARQLLRQRGSLVRVLRLQASYFLCEPGVRVLERPQVLAVPVGGVPQDLLEVIHTLLQGRVARQNHSVLVGELAEVGGMLSMRRPQSCQLARVLIRRIVDGPLQVANTVN